MKFKLIFFIYFSGLAAYFPYLSLYLERKGIPGTLIGVILAISPAIRTIATPLWGMLADVKKWHRQIFIFCSLGAALVAPFFMTSTTFWAFIIVQLLFNLLRSPLISITNKLLMEGQRKGEIDYGKSRILGSIGFCLVAVVSGKFADIYGLQSLYYYLIIAFIINGFLGKNLPNSTDVATTELGNNLVKFFNNKNLLIFLLTTTLIRIAAIPPVAYFSILINKLGVGNWLTGFAWGGSALVEIPIFFFSTMIIKKLGLKKTIFFSYIVYLLRMVLYNFSYIPAIAVVAQISNGLGFSIFYVAGINYVEELSPENIRTTSQTMYTAINMGLASFLGNIIGGFLYEQFGLFTIYKLSFVLTALAVIIFYQTQLRKEKQQIHQSYRV